MSFALGDIVRVAGSSKTFVGVVGEIVSFPHEHGDKKYDYGVEPVKWSTGILGFNEEHLILVRKWNDK